MSFGGFGGGFGQNNQQQQQPSTGFGGFGLNTTNTGFGSTGNTGFGSTNTTGGSLFGGGTTGGFGGSGGAFGSTTNNAFGAKPSGFGTPAATTGGSLFGNNTATAGTSAFGGGGFGSTNTTSPFGGGGTTGGSLFGANKPAFGGSTTGFGTAATTSPFGGAATSAFGSTAPSTALQAPVGECQGTGSVPFQAYVEKEPNSTTNQQNSFQNICFQAPYAKFSPEELRLADYNSGRRYGNASNQAGAFGQTNFGGFGQTNTTTGFGATNPSTTGTGLFGGTSTGFGTSQPASTGFGANTATAGGLFGAPKPATGSLFGSQPASTTGGLFGGGGTTGGFGSTTTGAFNQTNTNAGTSLFGGANKPATGFSFGSSQPAATGTGFGNTAATGGFGTGGGLFGSAQQAQNTSTPFGAQPATTPNAFGGFNTGTAQQTGTSSLFGGNNQQKPAAGGLWGTPAATNAGGLFPSSQPATGTSLFGGSTNQAGGLFGSASKPAAPGTSLFGSTNTQTNTGGGGSLFGAGFGSQNQNQQPQQNTSGSLFGGLNANNQQKPLFASTGTQQQGGLFGGNTATQQQGGLFGAMNNNQQQQQQQQPQNSLFGGGSLFGGSQQNQQAPQTFTASISDPTAFGTASMFTSLGSSQQIQNPGPLATPLSLNKQSKKPAALPMYKLNSASASRFATPQKRGGYGFSYSTYGTPNSASSAASTPGFTSSLVNNGGSFSSFGRGLTKSVSTSSLRRSTLGGSEDSILGTGVFGNSPNNRHFGSIGSMKKLTISRNIRQDLFSAPNPQSQPSSTSPLSGILKKRVSFSKEAANGTSSPLKQVNNAAPDSESLGYMRPKSSTNGVKPNGTATPPEMEQVSNSNNQLAIVNEEEPVVNQPAAGADPTDFDDKEPGEYWCKPSVAELKNMSRTQLSKLENFVVGRKNVGRIDFLAPVDLTGIDLDHFLGDEVQFKVRSASIYTNPATKPLPGKAMNQPSIISLENSWPRHKDRRVIDPMNSSKVSKHVQRLRRVPNCEFVDYVADKGIWKFKVPHYTTYSAPDYDDDETDGENEFGQSTLSLPPDTITPRAYESTQMDESFASTSQLSQRESEPEDTFEFKKKRILPGAFDDDMYLDEDMAGGDFVEQNPDSFLDERSVGSQSEMDVAEPMDQDDVFEDNESVSIMDQEMAGSFPEVNNTAELEHDSQDGDENMDVAETPGAILRARLRANNVGTPRKFAAGGDWTSTLKTTISPQKQDRALLKTLIDLHDNDSPEPAPNPATRRVVSDGRGFATSIDLMYSLFGQVRSPAKTAKIAAVAKGFEYPYKKRSKTGDHDTSHMSEKELAFHDSMKPSWGPDGTLVYAAPSNPHRFARSSRRASERDGLLTVAKTGVVSESRDIRFAKFSNEASADFLAKHKAITIINCIDGIPSAQLPERFSFNDFYNDENVHDPAAVHEKLVWQLASILYDSMFMRNDIPQSECNFDVAARLRKDNLSTFWQKLVEDACTQHVALAKSDEEKAIASLSGHKIAEACSHLMNGNDFHLATLVALIGSKNSLRKDMRQQLNDWRSSNILSEFSQPIRAIYELLAGNTCVCDGMKSSGIEDRIDTFVISKRFGLDWRQAFGLRLWYGTLCNESIEDAVHAFAGDLANDKETSRPQAWYVEQKVPALWEDPLLKQREDLLWGLLQLFTFEDTDIEDVLRPENSQLSPLDNRLSWQLSQALVSNGYRNDIQFSSNGQEKADRTSVAFAAQLTNEGSWLDAVFVLLHLSSPDARVKSIQDHLAHHAGFIGAADSLAFKMLTQTFKIPAAWIWEAKALYMRSVEKNPRGEVECLIQAGSFNEAHRTFAKEVAPGTIIELDYDTLRTLLGGFAGKELNISEWHLGGEIYQDFLELLDSDKRGLNVDSSVLERLLSGLPHAVEQSRNPGFMERVAVETMSGIVAKAVIAIGKKGKAENVIVNKVLRLPLTEDKYLKHTVELSLQYYRGVMASAR